MDIVMPGLDGGNPVYRPFIDEIWESAQKYRFDDILHVIMSQKKDTAP